MHILVSVRSVEEALLAASAGVHLIDLKEPREGALGALPLAVVRRVVTLLRERRYAQPISATIGDLPMTEPALIASRVEAVAGCGVDYVKVGIERTPAALRVLATLARCDAPVVPVFIADRGIDFALVALALAGPFPALMLDTADKVGGSLFERSGEAALRRFVTRAREEGRLAGLAGSLQEQHLPRLARLAPDFAGFRSAVCAADRTGALDIQRLRALITAIEWTRRPAGLPV